ncbi:hydroxyacylglutathione hydrolase [Prochlorococcus sp. MIT 1341]|uniref:hydroxyacylglutathione hydrolase n=1 Tax=Prochlorococcus sp. MIT 1341 TaxID=3096221 RepID=UPI002A751C7B|nr:hydroxyacylglutathione hydrolase [Prochlorococcus sp. MIT 1341]
MSNPTLDILTEEGPSSVNPIPVLNDNIIWVWTVGKKAVVIDPAIANPVEDWLEQRNYVLTAILQTHHHSDHIGGTKDLMNQWPEAEVIASAADISRIPFQTISVNDGDQISLLNNDVKVIEVSGHTRAHLAYFLPAKASSNLPPVLFCGDTLFGAGCGRLFEGSAKEMFLALKRLGSLPEETEVYCAHEYTEENLRWATSLYPNDEPIKKRLELVKKLRKNGNLSLPSKISLEKETNLFLRAQNIEEFTQLRLHKDTWKD